MFKIIFSLIVSMFPILSFAQTGWTGAFSTKYGELKLMEEYGVEYPGGGIIYGDYGGKGTIVGSLQENGKRFEGYFYNGSSSGKFSFRWNFDQKGFTGTWGYGEQMNAGSTHPDHQWTGSQKTKTQPADMVTSVWSGKWNTNHGYIILQQVGNKITGKYHTVGSIDATYDPAKKKVTGTFTNNGKKGYLEWQFEGNSFKGKWGWTAALTGGEWTGTKQFKTNKSVPAASSTTAPPPPAPSSTANNTGTVKFSIKPLSLSSLGSIYGFAGVQVFKLTRNGSEEIKSFGHKSQYFFNTTEDKIVAKGSSYNFPNTLDYLREFIVNKEDITSPETELQLKLFFHLKKEQIGPNKDYKYKTVTYNLKTLSTGELSLRSDVGPEIVQMMFKVEKK